MKRTEWFFFFASSALLLLLASGCGGQREPVPETIRRESDRVYVLHAYMEGYLGSGGEIDGQWNPDLVARKGETVSIYLINGENMVHDVALEKHGLRSELVFRKGESLAFTFEALRSDVYYCYVPGHREAGMAGRLLVED